MSPRSRWAFLLLILTQAAHSVEEYAFRLYEVFAPARFLAGVLNDDPAFGFALGNAGLVLFGLWCYAARVRPDHPSAPLFAWSWAVLEFVNGIGHTALALSEGGYFPGVATAPLLLGASTYLGVALSTRRP